MTTYHEDPTPGVVDTRLSRRAALRGAGGIGAALAGGAFLTRPSVSASQRGATMIQASPTTDGTPTGGGVSVALVHGAWADSSSWLGVITRLQTAGVPVQAISNPLRGVSADAAYVASAVGQIAGPVLLVGHSYAGSVISVAAAQATNVVGLVYVAAYVPDEGETVLGLGGQYPPTAVAAAIRPAPYPTADPATPGREFFLDPSLYHDAFAADLPEEQTRAMAVAQRPAADVAFGEPAGAIAWKTLPSWYAVATADQALGVELERFLADRAGSITVEIDASHSVAVSQPDQIADLIKSAVASLA